MEVQYSRSWFLNRSQRSVRTVSRRTGIPDFFASLATIPRLQLNSHSISELSVIHLIQPGESMRSYTRD